MKYLNETSPHKQIGKRVVIEQDDTSAIQLERNGVRSSTKRTKHINCRYYYVTDKIKAGEVSVIYKPTAEMWSDFHTKNLTGAPFIKHRETLMGFDPETEYLFYNKNRKARLEKKD